MTTYILGATGKIGRMLAFQARAAGLEWREVARAGPTDTIVPNGADLRRKGAFEPGATVINMVGYTGTDPVKLENSNQHFVQNLLSEAARCKVAHVILASSAAVYGAGSGHAFCETHPLNPLSAYGVSKVAMERLALEFAAQNASTALTILRIGNIAGADALLAAAKHRSANATPLPLHRFTGGVAALRSYIGPQDLFHAVRKLCPAPTNTPRFINVAHPQPVALDALLNAYKTHLLPDLAWENAPAPDGIPPAVTLASDKLDRLVQFKRHADPADAFARQIAAFEAIAKRDAVH